MNKLQILDNAPDGATHYCDDLAYWKIISAFDYYFWDGDEWVDSQVLENGTRSLADIERIVELEKSQERMAVFIKGHIKKWDYCRELQPSLQVLKRCLPSGGDL